MNKKLASDYERDRVEKYATYFKDREILLMPKLVEAVEPKTLSFVVTDLRTKRFVGLKKETFEDILKSANIQVSIFAAGALLPGIFLLLSEEAAKKTGRW